MWLTIWFRMLSFWNFVEEKYQRQGEGAAVVAVDVAGYSKFIKSERRKCLIKSIIWHTT